MSPNEKRATRRQEPAANKPQQVERQKQTTIGAASRPQQSNTTKTSSGRNMSKRLENYNGGRNSAKCNQKSFAQKRRRRASDAPNLLAALLGVCLLASASSGQRISGGAPDSDESPHCKPQTVGQRLLAGGATLAQGAPLAAPANQQQQPQVKKVFCFYDIQDDFRPQDLNACLCTHVVYSYVAVRRNLSFIAGKKGDLRSLASLKRRNPSLKLLVSLRPDDYFSFGAIAHEQPPPPQNAAGGEQIAILAAPSRRFDAQQPPNVTAPPIGQPNEMHQKFAKRVRDFIVRHSLDGVNLDWPYFAQTMQASGGGGGDSGGAPTARDHLTWTLQALNENFQVSLAQAAPSSAYLRNQAPIVTLTASKDFYSLVDSYDFHSINKLLDFVHLPAFDFDLNVDQYSIGHPARLHGISDAENLDTLVDLLLSSGLPSEQLLAGVPAHGVQITSKPIEPSDQKRAQNIDEQLEAAANISIVSHSEVCRVRKLARQNCSATATATAASGGGGGESTSCWSTSRARDLTAPFAYNAEHWLGFDDELSAKLKAKYVLLRHLAGVSLFTVNNDDPTGSCGLGPFPLLATINAVLARAATTAAQPPHEGAGPRAAGFTRAPNQLLTATSLVSQIFGKKLPVAATTASPDLMSSASNEAPTNHRREGPAAGNAASDQNLQQQQQGGLVSFVDIIEKYGAISRLDKPPAGASGELVDEWARLDQQLPCDRVGYQRYPRDCSRFYRCVQTPPTTTTPTGGTDLPPPPPPSGQVAPASGSSITRLQYECPSGLVFDEQFQICNWPSWSAQCTGSGEVNSITNTKFVCPNYGYFQNQENCEYFYYCSDYNRGKSQAYQFKCPFELGFDEEKLQCNWKWLVRGCTNSTGTPTTTSSPQNAELAQKYLDSLAAAAAAPTDSQRQQRPPQAAETSLASGELQKSNSSDTISKRSDEEQVGGPVRREGRAAFVPAIGSHVTSLLASAAAIREHRMKKAAAASATADVATQSPSGAPSSLTATGFRQRRRQQQTSPSAQSGQDGGESGGMSPPYRRRPPPNSVLPFLPSSAVHMVVDSLRSYGEAIQDEVNRYMRIAGDKVRDLLGPRPAKAAPSSSHANRRGDQEKLARLASKLSGGTSGASLRVQVHDNLDDVRRRLKRNKRDATSAGDQFDLQALESGRQPVGASWARPPQQTGYLQQQHHVDPLGRPPGYPLNPLDEAAKAAVLGPEPKMYSQPAALVSSQMSAISRDEYERLVFAQRGHQSAPRPPGWHANHPTGHQQTADLLAGAASEQSSAAAAPIPAGGTPQIDHNRVIERIMEQARTAFTLSHNQQPPQQVAEAAPYGMPSAAGLLPGRKSTAQPVEAQRRRTSVAMKLATLAIPRFLPATTSTTTSTTKAPLAGGSSSQGKAARGGYMSSFFPNLGDVVSAPARSLMSKAMGINKAVQDLISTLSPSSVPAANKNAATISGQQVAHLSTTPLPTTMPIPIPLHSFQQQLQAQQVAQQQQQAHLQQQQQQHHHNHQQHQQTPPPLPENKSPLLLTESEAHALSAQLDQLSKEQLELLSQELNKSDQAKFAGQQRQPQQSADSQDYVVRLLRVLSQTSHNPEDIKLLDQLAGQLNNPQLGNGGGGGGSSGKLGDDSSLIEIGQPDDLALLEALGLLPNKPQHNSAANSTTSSRQQQQPQRDTDNQAAASYNVQSEHVANMPHEEPRAQIKKLMQLYKQQNGQPANEQPPQGLKFVEHESAEHFAIETDLGVTKLVPVTLQFEEGHEATTEPAPRFSEQTYNQPPPPSPSYNQPPYHDQPPPPPAPQSYSQQQPDSYRDQQSPPQSYSQQPPPSYQPPPPPAYHEAPQQPYEHNPPPQSYEYNPPEPVYTSYEPYYPTTTTTTTTTTSTTRRPTQLVTQVFEEQFIERPVPPVRQTFTELVENNVTTPDGIETSLESRTKTSISAGANFNIGSQLGLGMIPSAFGGALPSDSPLAVKQQQQEFQSQMAAAANGSAQVTGETQGEPQSGATSNSTTSKKESTLEMQRRNVSANKFATKGGSQIVSGDEFRELPNAQQLVSQAAGSDVNSFDLQLPNSDFVGQTGSGGVPVDGVQQFGLADASGSSATASGFSAPPTSGSMGSSTLSGYNFATQPVNQFEEVVIKKKFKPFPKTMIVPQVSSTSFEQVQGMQPQPQVTLIEQQQQQQQQVGKQIERVRFSTSGQTASASSFGASEGGESQTAIGSASATSTGAIESTTATATQSARPASSASQQFETQIKDEEFSTIASTFGETAEPSATGSGSEAATSGQSTSSPAQLASLTRQDIESGQRLEQLEQSSQIRQDLQRIEQQMAAAEALRQATTLQAGERETSTPTVSVSKVSPSKKSQRKSSNRKRKQKTSAATSKPPRSVDAVAATPTTAAPQASGNRVEAAFSNFMVELKRSRKPNKSGAAADEEKKPKSGAAPKSEAATSNNSNSAQPTTTTTTQKPAQRDSLELAATSSTKRKLPAKRQRGQTKSRKSNKKTQQVDEIESSATTNLHQFEAGQQTVFAADRPRGEQIEIYGTKSGFMPIIRKDDPNYYATGAVEPLAFGASFASSKQQAPPSEMRLAPASNKQRGRAAEPHKRPSSAASSSASWRSFVRRLSDQISVVNLGNYSEQAAGAQKLVQVKLVIMPSTPNNQLLNPKNWRHLAASYPQVFAANLAELNAAPIELGAPSVSATSGGGSIDGLAEEARYNQFVGQFGRLSRLIEPRTFKALDEIVQRSSGQLFMIQRRDTLDRMIVAVLPERPLIRSPLAGEGGAYERLLGAKRTTTTTTTTTPTTTTVLPTTATSTSTASTQEISSQPPSPQALKLVGGAQQTPAKAATFSRAIQESIQEAIRQHYKSAKSKLEQSLGAQTQDGADKVTSAPVVADRQWLTPATDALVRMESSQSHALHADPLEAAGSSTEFSVVVPPLPVGARETYTARSILEVEGAEAKQLYKIDDLNGAQSAAARAGGHSDLVWTQTQAATTPTDSATAATTTTSTTRRPAEESSAPTVAPAAPKPTTRFMSIGSHLIAAPQRRIVDQAYVSHFYDHIGADQPQTKSRGQHSEQTGSNGQQHELAKKDADLATANDGDGEERLFEQDLISSARNQEDSLVPESACTRAGLFQHPFACNKFYECFWDKQLNKYTLHMFECPIKLAFDDRIVGCAMPIESSLCVNY